MENALRVHTTVLPGNRVEVRTPGLREGAAVEVVVIPKAPGLPNTRKIFDSLKGERLHETAQEADEYLKRERDSWGS